MIWYKTILNSKKAIIYRSQVLHLNKKTKYFAEKFANSIFFINL
jgi:hypothetical protein